MKKFFEKFLSPELLAQVEAAYLAKNPNLKELPEYVSKERFDEVNKAKTKAEGDLNTLTKTHDTLKTEHETLKTAKEKADTDLAAAKKDSEVIAAIYKAGGKNEKAIKALIDPAKPIAEEIERVKKSDPYMFGIGGGFGGEGGNGGGGGGDDAAAEAKRKAAVLGHD